MPPVAINYRGDIDVSVPNFVECPQSVGSCDENEDCGKKVSSLFLLMSHVDSIKKQNTFH